MGRHIGRSADVAPLSVSHYWGMENTQFEWNVRTYNRRYNFVNNKTARGDSAEQVADANWRPDVDWYLSVEPKVSVSDFLGDGPVVPIETAERGESPQARRERLRNIRIW